jgi:predicted ATPase
MATTPNKLSQFWQELRRRKVLPFLIAYITACVAIIGLSSDVSETFSISKETVKLVYLLLAIGIPIVIVLPWFINRKKPIAETEETSSKKTSSEEAAAKHNLPAQLTTFIGREKEMQTVKDLVSGHRLVTLTGPGGCGKTRMSIELAAQLVPAFEDGVWFVNLAPITNEDRVVVEIAEALSITGVADKPLIEALIETIKEQKMMILLDNCEHLIKTCAEVSGQLIQFTSHLKILATSRESMCITGEQVWRVPSLTLLDPKAIIDLESVRRSEAVMLFNDRARLNNPEFELVAENVTEVATICNKLDGMPLAVELVASRTRHMDPKMILDRFGDRFERVTSSDPGISKRQKTLQATIEWSYNLLSDSEKLLFTRLSVFSGGFDLAAAEEVCYDDQLPKEIILETLSALVDRSLIYTMKAAGQPMRYNCLETLRQFGQHLIEDSTDQDALNKKHCQYYLSLAEEAYLERYEEQLKWLNTLDIEEDNLMAALEWTKEHSPEEFCWLAGSLAWYWMSKTKLVLGRQFLEAAHSIEKSKPEIQARILQGLGWLLSMFNEYEKGIELGKESLNIWRGLNNLQEQAFVLAQIGYFYSGNPSDIEIRLSYSEQGLDIARQLGKPGLINYCLTSICNILVHSKQFERGLPFVEELIESSEKLEQPWGIMSARHYHSDCALAQKDYQEAERRYGLGVRLAVNYGNDWIAFADMQGVAFALSGQRRWKKSLRLNAASVEKSRTMGVSLRGMLEFWDEWTDTYIEGAIKEVGEELARRYEAEGTAMGFEKAVEYALDFEKD